MKNNALLFFYFLFFKNLVTHLCHLPSSTRRTSTRRTTTQRASTPKRLSYCIPKVMLEYDDPFVQYNISDKWKLLENLQGRVPCLKCSKSRKIFCYSCYIPLPRIKEIVPHVSLPIKIDILKHRKEIDGKSTSVHAAILAPDHVTIYRYPDQVPEFPNDGKTVIIYPARDAYTVKHYFEEHPIIMKSRSDLKDDDKLGKIFIGDKVFELPFNRAIFIDSTWSQSKAMYNVTKGLPAIMLQSRLSYFWRHQKNSPRWYLATVEAIHQWLNEIHQHCLELSGMSPTENQINEYDNLLFFFRHMYHVIHQLYDHNELLSFRRPVNLTYH